MKKKILGFLALVCIPVAIMLIFSVVSKGFGVGSIPIVINQSVLPLMIGFGLYVTSITGMFDFSVGVRALAAGMVGAVLAKQFGTVGLVIGSMVGGILGGIVIGVIYRYLKVPSMVAALGFVMIFEIVAFKFAGSSGFISVSKEISKAGSYPFNIIYAAVACLVMYVVYYNTKIGQEMKAVGNAENLARNVGMNTDHIKFMAWVISGIFCGLGGIIQVCYSGTITASANLATMNLVFKPLIGQLIGIQLIALYDNVAILILVGEIIIATLFNGFISLGMGDVAQNIVLGVFLIIIMAISSVGSRKKAKAA